MARAKKRKVLVTIVMILIVLAIGVGIFFAVNKFIEKDNKNNNENIEQNEVFDLPDITYSNMQVKDIEMEFLKETTETMVSMVIENTSENKIEKEKVNAILLDKDGNTLGQTQTYIEILDVGEQYRISVVLKGDLTATTAIQLQKAK